MKRLLLIPLAVGLIIASLSCEWMDIGNPKEPEPMTMEIPLDESITVNFTGTENHRLPEETGLAMMERFRADNPFDAYGWYFGRKAIEELLGQPDCVGIRIYGGADESGKFSPVLFGVTEDGRDINGAGLSKELKPSVIVLEMAAPCPPYCKD
jgi:hypothetical protein